ncbi:MAG: PHP domain-containing protein, partial [Chitinispirillaceae bacterium]|nr:PHP domain-containing protein [Chitinispirillaceae bacterium]
MLQADLHVHSTASSCGLHTILELLAHADRMGMKAIAITDHGPALSSRLTTVFFERFLSPYPEITVYKGLELNVLDESGSIDFPKNFMPFVDLVTVGRHGERPDWIAVIKRGLELRGHAVGPVRRPMLPLTEE